MPDHNIPFLTVTTKGGWYGYRRRIPKHLRPLFDGKSELIKSFKTKNLDIAQLELRKLNEWFEHKIASNGGTQKIKGELPRDRVRAVISDLTEAGLHPDSQPEINVHTDPEQISNLLNDVLRVQLLQLQFQEGKISRQELLENIAELNLEGTALYKLKKFGSERRKLKEKLSYKYVDKQRLNVESIDPNIDCDADDYVMPQVTWDETDPEVIRYRVMCGENLLPDPTWQNALDDYLKRNLKNKVRNPEQVQKHKTATISLAKKLSQVFPKGMETPLKHIEQSVIESYAEAAWPNLVTCVRNLRTLKAVWRSWNRNNQLQKVEHDPFTPVVHDIQGLSKQHETKRRSLTPKEFQHFYESILDEPNNEIKLIGLLMAYCGAPTGEAAGLQRQDVVISCTVPYVWFRNHKDRIMGKKRQERIVPLIDPILGLLTDYLTKRTFQKNDPIFPKYGVGTHSSSERSKKLSKHINNMRNDFDDRHLTPYSLRHTFKDRATKAQVPEDVIEYLMGHRAEQSSRTNDGYGTGLPAEALVDWMRAIQEVKEHGHFQGDNQR